MNALAPKPQYAKTRIPGRKTASGSSGKNPNKHTYRIDPQALKTLRENDPTATKTASGVSVYGFRYYTPETGRWLSRDPIGEEGGNNLYAFAMNGPVNGIDRLGLDAVVISGGINVSTTSDPLHDNNWMNFVTAAELHIKKLKKVIPEGERVEWHVSRPSYRMRALNDRVDENKYLNEIEKIAERLDVDLRYFDTSDEMATITSKVVNQYPYDSNSPKYWPRIGDRMISSWAYFGHGRTGALMPNGMSQMRDISGGFTYESLGKILVGAFKVDCICTANTCNSSSEDKDGKSFTSEWKQRIGLPMHGLIGRMNYAPTAVGKTDFVTWFFLSLANLDPERPEPKGPIPGTRGPGHEFDFEGSVWGPEGPPLFP